MKAKYPSIFNQELNYKEHFIYSTNYNRTITSAVSHFYGLQNKIVDTEFPFEATDKRTNPPQPELLYDVNATPKTTLVGGAMPFPVHTWLDDGVDPDVMMQAHHSCPLTKKSMNKQLQALNTEVASTPKFTALLEEAKKKFKVTDQDFDKDMLDIKKCYFIADQMIMDY